MSSSGSMRSPGQGGAISKRFNKARRRGNSQGEALSSGSGSAFGGMSPVGSFGNSGRNTISFGKTALSSSPATTPGQHMNSIKDDASGFVSSKTGFLTKRAMSSMDAFANWKERFFVLAEGHLSYYKQGGGFFNTGKEDIVHLKGELELTPDTIVRKSNIDDKANCFEVVTPTKKMFCQASTAREMEDWVKSVRAHINALKKSQMRGSFHDAAPVNLGASGGPGVMAGMGALLQGSSMETDYSRPSMLEDHEIVRGADKSSDPKDIVIKQLLEENRSLREQLTMKDQVIHELETNGGRSLEAPAVGAGKLRSTAPQMILDLRDVKKKQFQLFDAAEVGNWHLIATLLRDNVVDVNGVGINQTSALHLAARNNHPNAVKELLARGADPSARTGDSYTALHIAVQAGNVECVKELLDAGADPNVTDYQGNAAIHMAAESGDIPIAKLLVARGARIDAPNASGSLPVHLSPIGHPIRVLLGSGSNLAATNPSQPPKPRNEMAAREGNATQVSHLAFKNKYQQDLALGPRDFEFVKVLGRGAFAKVYLVRGKGSNRDKWYALKAYNKQAIVQKNQAQYIHTEKAALQACSDHPYIVTLYYAFQSQDRLFLRLGSGPTGDREIFDHPFFAGVNWEKLKARELSPPFQPKIKKDPSGVPDTSNFPQAFTDQEISEMERGFDLMDPNAAQVQRPNPNGHKDDKRLFKDFDFTPELQLDNEAKQFEQLALQQNSFKNLPPPALLETDEYSI
ncbi:hypothetical protein PC129_g9897 [Phytophthora cactorum]|uniref:Ankyrin repeat-containing domain n=1 Tax=Phytophthora cactorum TaxID=29920 RepID=A0A8T1I4G3_9STRA|nr:hypothetical protein Pcac1_g11935 [Phytophthora cactorum]KAG3219331.1 hypothetical protein PC129_g9897 [Phytophthora cactorum]